MFKNADERLRSGWKILFVTLAFLAVATVLSAIVGMVVGLLLITNGNYDALKPNPNNPTVQLINLIGQVIQSLCMIVVPLFAWKVIMKRKFKDMGLHSFKTDKKDLFMGLFLGAVSIFVVFLLLTVTGFVTVERWIPEVSQDTFTYLILFILVGFGEEIYGRGFIMGALKQTKNVPIIIIVSSVIFSLLHGTNKGFAILPFVNLTLVGALFSYMYIKSNHIWMCIGFHITWNYFLGNVFGLNVSGIEVQGLISTAVNKENIFTGEQFGPEGGLFVTFILLLNFLVVTLYYNKKKIDFLASEREYEDQIFLQTKYPYQQPYDMYHPQPMEQVSDNDNSQSM